MVVVATVFDILNILLGVESSVGTAYLMILEKEIVSLGLWFVAYSFRIFLNLLNWKF